VIRTVLQTTPALILVGIIFLSSTQIVWANKPEQIQRKNIKTFEKAQRSFELSDYQSLSTHLDKLASSPNLNNLELAYIAHYRGSACFRSNNIECAVEEYEKIIAKKKSLSEKFYRQIVLVLANISFDQENYGQFQNYANEYLSALPAKARNNNILLGQSYLASQDYEKGLSFVLDRLHQDSSSNRILRSDWVYLLIKFHKELNQLDDLSIH